MDKTVSIANTYTDSSEIRRERREFTMAENSVDSLKYQLFNLNVAHLDRVCSRDDVVNVVSNFSQAYWTNRLDDFFESYEGPGIYILSVIDIEDDNTTLQSFLDICDWQNEIINND